MKPSLLRSQDVSYEAPPPLIVSFLTWRGMYLVELSQNSRSVTRPNSPVSSIFHGWPKSLNSSSW